MDRYQLTSVDYDARQGRTACFSSGMTGHFTGSSRRLKLALLREGESLEPHTQDTVAFLGRGCWAQPNGSLLQRLVRSCWRVPAEEERNSWLGKCAQTEKEAELQIRY